MKDFALAAALAAAWAPYVADMPNIGWGGSPRHKPNGGTPTGAAAAKRRARRLRNCRKNPRGAA